MASTMEQVYHTRKWATSSNRVRSQSSRYKEYTTSRPYTETQMNTIHRRHIKILYANIISFTMLKNKKANNLKRVKMAKAYSHGTIFFSCSFRRAVIKIREVTKTTIPPSMENNAKTIRAFGTEKEKWMYNFSIHNSILHVYNCNTKMSENY